MGVFQGSQDRLSLEQSNTVMPNAELLLTKRKVRKGTRSCWECKRRKIRCIIPATGDAKCDFCQRRRVPCAGQEIPEALALPKKGNRGINDRMARVEDVVKKVLAGKDIVSVNRIERQSHPPSDVSVHSPPSVQGLPTPENVR